MKQKEQSKNQYILVIALFLSYIQEVLIKKHLYLGIDIICSHVLHFDYFFM